MMDEISGHTSIPQYAKLCPKIGVLAATNANEPQRLSSAMGLACHLLTLVPDTSMAARILVQINVPTKLLHLP